MAKILKVAYQKEAESKENNRAGGPPGYGRKPLTAPNFEYARITVDAPHFVQLRVQAINEARNKPEAPVKQNWLSRLLKIKP